MGIFRALVISAFYTAIQYILFVAFAFFILSHNFTVLPLIAIATAFVFLQSFIFWAALIGGLYLMDKSFPVKQ